MHYGASVSEVADCTATTSNCIIGASVSEPHLGSSTRPLSVSLSVCLSIYIYTSK